jgi:PP-loop superfamily ATP-utilizing enzyme
MKLKEEIRNKIATDYKLRSDIGRDCNLHERTIQKWAKEKNPNIETKPMILLIATYFPEHDNILED